jgi:hypothetical protein
MPNVASDSCGNRSRGDYKRMWACWLVRPTEALKRFPLEAKVHYEMGPSGPGTIGKAQYVKAWG